MPLEFVPIVGERSRTYLFSSGTSLTIKEVIKLCVRPSGNHRLETKTGKKYIICAQWDAIIIDCDAWDF